MKGMKGIQTVLSFIQMADPKNGFYVYHPNLTDPFHKKYCFVFLQISQPTHRPLHHKEIVQHWNI